jgi:hypothetical protein
MGTVYEIVHNQDNNIRYVGSTTMTLKIRMTCMKAHYKHFVQYQSKFISVYRQFDKYGIENFTMNPLAEYKGISRKQLRQKEQEWIDRLMCVNKIRAYMSPRDYIEYLNRNKESLRIKSKTVRVHCTCGSDYGYTNRVNHGKTILHMRREFNLLMME